MTEYLYINTSFDRNIWHVFVQEILEIGRLLDKNVVIDNMLLCNYNENSSIDKWKLNILQYLVKNIYVALESKNINNKIVKSIPRETIFYQPVMLQIHFQWINCWTPTNYIKYNNMFNFIEYLKQKMNIKCELKYIKFINRRKSRTVYDINTKQPIEYELKKYGIKCAYFEDLSPEEQINFVKDAKILISPHGAGLTNLIFTHPNCIISEITFRKYFYCNPVCDKHISGMLPIHQNCGTGNVFANYDFINLCKLLGKKHIELEPDSFDKISSSRGVLGRDILMNVNNMLQNIKKNLPV